MPEPLVKANADNVKAITDFLIKNGLGEWMALHPDTQVIDMFMAGHAIHKFIVAQAAFNWQLNNKIPAEKTIRMADLTFRRAMRELWRGS